MELKEGDWVNVQGRNDEPWWDLLIDGDHDRVVTVIAIRNSYYDSYWGYDVVDLIGEDGVEQIVPVSACTKVMK